MLDPLRLRQLELRVLEVDVMHDLGDRPECVILETKPFDEDFEGAAVAFMRVLRFEHVEANLPGLRPIALACDELEGRVSIDEAANEPGAGHAVDVDSLPGHPGPTAELPGHPGRLRPGPFTPGRRDQPFLDAPQESVHDLATGSAEE